MKIKYIKSKEGKLDYVLMKKILSYSLKLKIYILADAGAEWVS